MDMHRLRSSTIWGWIAVGLGVVVAIAQLATSGLADAHVGLGLGLASAGLGWAVFLRPAVGISPDEVVFRNVIQRATIAVSRIASVELKWSLEVVGDDGRRMGSFAAPVSSAARRARTRGAPGDETGTEDLAGEIAALVDQRAAAAAAAGAGPSVIKQPEWAGIGIVVASAVAALVALLG